MGRDDKYYSITDEINFIDKLGSLAKTGKRIKVKDVIKKLYNYIFIMSFNFKQWTKNDRAYFKRYAKNRIEDLELQDQNKIMYILKE